MRLPGVLLPVLWVAPCLTLHAEAQVVDQAIFQKFLASDVHKGLVARAVSAIPAGVFHTCTGLVSSGSTVTLMRFVAFGQDGVPNAGGWLERFPVSGCGSDTILNIYFAVGRDGRINTTIGLPGTTHTNLVLQRDAMTYIYAGVGGREKACQRFDVKDTKFEAYGLRDPATPDPGPGDRFRPWWETWTVAGCEHSYAVPVDFVPDRTGTRIIQPQGGIVAR